MEDFSKFITEEVFLLDSDSHKSDESNSLLTETNHKLAVITGEISKEEDALLKKILSSLNLESNDIIRAKEVDREKSKKWLIFTDSPQLESERLEFYQPSVHQGHTFLLAQSLSALRESQQEKKKLWDGLKRLFDI